MLPSDTFSTALCAVPTSASQIVDRLAEQCQYRMVPLYVAIQSSSLLVLHDTVTALSSGLSCSWGSVVELLLASGVETKRPGAEENRLWVVL